MLSALLATILRAQVPAEEWDHVVLKAVGNVTGMGTVVNIKAVFDAVVIEDLVELDHVEPQPSLVAYVERDRAVSPQVVNILIDERERGVGRPFRDDVGLRDAVLHREIEIKRRVLGVGRPCGCRSEPGTSKEGQASRIGGR